MTGEQSLESTLTNRSTTQNFGALSRRQAISKLVSASALALLGGGCSHNSNEIKKSASANADPNLLPANILPPPGASPLEADRLAWALQFLEQEVSVDLHCHPGAFFFNGFSDVHPSISAMRDAAGFEARTIADMIAGGLSTALVATVADGPLIAANSQGLYARREFRPGEAYAEHKRQMTLLHSMLETNPANLVGTHKQISTTKVGREVNVMFATEGGDFLEQTGERIEEAYADGIRSIALVHYHVNQIGDIQTAPPKHNGLTDFGLEAIDEMNRVGIIIDLAHATFATTQAAAERSSKPIVVSHSFLADQQTQHPRLLSKDHAKVIAATGGLIGGWPSGVGNPDFPAFVRRLISLVDLVGIDHVGLGTDMDANYKPVFSNYRQLPYLVAALQSAGLHRHEISKLLGGNFLRVQSEVST